VGWEIRTELNGCTHEYCGSKKPQHHRPDLPMEVYGRFFASITVQSTVFVNLKSHRLFLLHTGVLRTPRFTQNAFKRSQKTVYKLKFPNDEDEGKKSRLMFDCPAGGEQDALCLFSRRAWGKKDTD
jgi:hypothetical protein